MFILAFELRAPPHPAGSLGQGAGEGLRSPGWGQEVNSHCLGRIAASLVHSPGGSAAHHTVRSKVLWIQGRKCGFAMYK